MPKNYKCSVCEKEFNTKKVPPKVIMNFRQQATLICPDCQKARETDIKDKIKVSAQVILPGGYFGV